MGWKKWWIWGGYDVNAQSRQMIRGTLTQEGKTICEINESLPLCRNQAALAEVHTQALAMLVAFTSLYVCGDGDKEVGVRGSCSGCHSRIGR